MWPGVAVEENNLAVQISALRRAVDTGRPEGGLIQTVPGRGYRFAAEVKRLKRESPDAASVRGKARTTPAAIARPAGPSIAVMPFTNMSSDPEQDYFADGPGGRPHHRPSRVCTGCS